MKYGNWLVNTKEEEMKTQGKIWHPALSSNALKGDITNTRPSQTPPTEANYYGLIRRDIQITDYMISLWEWESGRSIKCSTGLQMS